MGVSDSLVNATAFPLDKVPRGVKPVDEEVRIDCGGISDQWYFYMTVKKPSGVICDNKRAILYIHGNGETIYSTDEFLQTVADKLQTSVFSFDIPGYGKVPGKPSEELLVDCAQRALYFVKRRGYETHSITVWARSLGSVAGVRLAGSNNIGHLVLESPLASANDALKVPVPVKIRQFNNLECLETVRCGITIVAGSRDEVLDWRRNALKLYAAKVKQLAEECREVSAEISLENVAWLHLKAKGCCYKNIALFVLDGGHHNDLGAFFCEELLDIVRKYSLA